MAVLYLVAVAMAAVVLFATFYKMKQVRRASRWPSAQGRVVSSGPQERKVPVMSDVQRADGKAQYETRNFAHIVYEYSVGARKLSNDRVSIGEDRGNFEVAETVARYPVGKPVTVYYNPKDPNEAVLERDPPAHLWGCVWAIAIIPLVGLVIADFGFSALTDKIAGAMGSWDRAAQTVALGSFGALLALFALAMTLIAAKARRWPVVDGLIQEAYVDEFRGQISGVSRNSYRDLAQSVFNYTYVYNGVTYTSDKLSAGTKITASTTTIAKREVAPYRPGDTVKVYVNPNNPSEAVLDPGARYVWVIWVAAAVLAGIAIYAALKV